MQQSRILSLCDSCFSFLLSDTIPEKDDEKKAAENGKDDRLSESKLRKSREKLRQHIGISEEIHHDSTIEDDHSSERESEEKFHDCGIRSSE